MSVLIGNNNIVTDGLSLYLDTGNFQSYPETGINFYDLSPYKNNSLLINSPTYVSTGGKSIALNGTNQLIYTGTNTSTLLSSFSLLIFIKLDRVTGTQMLIGRCGGASAFYAHNYYWTVSNGYLYLSFRDTTGNYPSATSNVLLSINTIYQLCVTYSSAAGLSFYINGVQRNTFSSNNITTQTPFLSAASVLAIGSNYAEGKDYTKGNVYTSQIYNRVLTGAEILQNYNVLKSRFI